MTDDAPASLTIDPPIAAWRLGEASSGGREARAELAPLLDTLGLHDTPFDPALPVVATGHQAWFWHPGILAKDLAMTAACERLQAQPVHLIVDHIANPALTIDVPIRRGDALHVEPLRLGGEDLRVGTAHRPPLTRAQLTEAIHRLRENVEGEIMVDLDRLLDVPPGFDTLDSLADSITALQLHAVHTWCPERSGVAGVFVLRTSQLARLSLFQALTERMLQDAGTCVAAYNDAASRVPQAGVAPLLVERDRVELPLWVVEPGGVLGRVFADLADTMPLLTREDGTAIEPVTTDGSEHLPLAPKALTLTTLMRSALCDLFIHGTGGGVYEQVTEYWWGAWQSGTAVSAVGEHDGRDAHPTEPRPEPLAPLAVVSADVRLDFETPIATQRELDRAVWLRHHLPHNIDRFVDDPATLDADLLTEKDAILSGDPADHDKNAKLAARRRLRAINHAFVAQHPALIAQAAAAAARARQGVANAQTAARRDWCFQLYPPQQLAALRGAIHVSVQVP